jgi:uncharacterized membrane protein YfcA
VLVAAAALLVPVVVAFVFVAGVVACFAGAGAVFVVPVCALATPILKHNANNQAVVTFNLFMLNWFNYLRQK